MKTTATMQGSAQLTSMYDEAYKEYYHIVVIKWNGGHSTVVVLDDNSKPIIPVPYACWGEIDRLRGLTS